MVALIIEGTGKPLFIFDFDDTLAETHSRIWVTNSKKKFALTPAQYAVYHPASDDVFDFGEFQKLIRPTELPKYVQRLRSAIKSNESVSIVTARGSSKPIVQFLKQIGITHGVKIVAVNSSDPKKKTDYIERKLKQGYTDVVMYDDSPKNIEAFKELGKKYPNIYFHGHEVPAKSTPDNTDFIRSSLEDTIKNPETGNDILVKTALGYPKDHAAHELAVRYLHRQRKTGK